jgi:arylsulfatase A-like enzyme
MDAKRPNVLLILTDDQGWGDVGCHGNPHLATPNIDRLAAEGVELSHFYVCPVCAPTRAGLMTGRYNYRTRAIDTYIGRAMMDPDEVTVAQMLSAAGYRTGIFGKWHLGDNFPLRPIDRGFQTAVWHLGGGMCQPSDPPGSPGYFDPIIQIGAEERQVKGYCTDIFVDAALEFITANRDRPFFCYLPTNAPHGPLQVDEKYAAPYRAAGLGEQTAKLYGMIANIDENVGRLLARLKDLGLERDTLVIFLGDNGPQQGDRFNGVLRATKGTVYDGGIRVACFARWPGRLPAGAKMDALAAHIDITPTLLAACGAKAPAGVKFDGRDILPLLEGGAADDRPARTLYFQWHRGDEPVLYRDAAAREPQFKLVMHLDKQGQPRFELYDMIADPGEKTDLAAEKPDVVARMRRGYEAWFKDVSATRGYAPPRIVLGSPKENPSRLSRQDWRGPRAGWAADSLGHYEVRVDGAGEYDVTLLFPAKNAARQAVVKLGDVQARADVHVGAAEVTLPGLKFAAGDARLEAWLEGGEKPVGPHYVVVKRMR